MPKRLTQRQRVLQALQEANGRSVPGYVLAQAGGLQWQTRVWELRHIEGHNIRCDIQHVGGEVHSSYTLLPPKGKQGGLFPDQPTKKRGHWLEVVGRRI